MRHYLCVWLCVFELTRLCTLPVSTVRVCGHTCVCARRAARQFVLGADRRWLACQLVLWRAH